MKIKKGDTVVMLTGKDKGRSGNVLVAMPREDKVIVQGVNMVTKHQKPTQASPDGGIIKKEMPVHISNIAFADPKDGKATRVGYKTLDDGKKTRFAKKSGEVING